ncbi:MAG: hypothetical protein GY805_35855, partial [Chloroflexi bacterium]|nr:hypothetical protein [Chloroflexota bacterium]
DEVKAINWLRENVGVSSIILGSYQTGNLVAAQTGQQVMLGHWAETADFVGKETAVAQFFNGETSPTWRQQLLTQFNIDTIWFGPREQALGNFDPESATYLQSIFQNKTITIYTVKP